MVKSQSDSAIPVVKEPSVTREETTSDPAVNIHRWGSVSMFHGLPSDSVNAIAQDKNGAMWFGTNNGLVRYDGRKTELYGNIGDRRGQLPSQYVQSLFCDAAGILWIGTASGAVTFDHRRFTVLPETKSFSITSISENSSPEQTSARELPFKHQVLITSEQGTCFIGENALTEIQRSGNQFSSNLTLRVIDRQTQSVLAIRNEETGMTEPVRLKAGLFDLRQNQWWLGAHRRGVLALTDNIREAIPPPTRPYFVNALYSNERGVWIGAQGEQGLWLNAQGRGFENQNLTTGTITSIHGSRTEVWIATESRGAFLLRDNGVVEQYSFENTKGGLRSDHLNTIFLDADGVAWFGTDRGVSRFDRASFRAATVSSEVQSNFIRSLLKAPDQSILAGTNRGLFKLNAGLELGAWTKLNELENQSIYCLWLDQQQQIWAGTNRGVYRRDANSEVFRLIQSDLIVKNFSEVKNQLSAFAIKDNKAQLFIFDGDKFIPKPNSQSQAQLTALDSGRFAASGYYADAAGAIYALQRDHLPVVVSGKTVQALTEHQDQLWIGTNKGLYVWNGTAIEPILEGVEVQSLYATQNYLYCATLNAGLLKILPREKIIARFDREQGLPSQKVFAVAEGGSGELWIGTNAGIVRYQPSDRKPLIEPVRLVADSIYYADQLVNEMKFPSYVREYLLEVVGLGGKTFPSQFLYEFQVTDERGQSVKRYVDRDPQLKLERVNPGNYKISIRSISRDLSFSDPYLLKLQISAEQISWTTILLTTLLLAALVAGGFAFYQQRRTARANQQLAVINSELRRARMLLANTTEAERNRIARDLHDQTLADLRNLLVMTDQIGREHGPTPVVLRKKIEEVSNEIRHICEDLSPSVLENIGFIPALEWALSDSVRHLPVDGRVAFEFTCDAGVEDRLQLNDTERIQLYRIVQEAINNVVRHAQASHVKLSVQIENERNLIIDIIDDGVGLLAGGENPTGHGMANIRSRANLVGADVEWPAIQSGCHFRLHKPNAIHPKSSQDL